MKWWYALIFILIFGLLPAEGPKPVQFPEDERVWLFQGVTPVGEATYLPEGQSKEEWSDVMMFRFVPAVDMPLPIYYERYIDMLNERAQDKFRSRILETTEESILFEWWVEKEEKSQHGWIQLRKVPGGVQFFRFTTKEIDALDKRGKVWEQILKNHTFELVPQKVHFNLKWDNAGKKWEQKESDDGMVYTFYPEGEEQGNWRERLTIYIWNRLDVSSDEYFTIMKENLKEKYGDEIKIREIRFGKYGVFFEWSNGEMAELFKMQHIVPGITVLMRYSVKEPDGKLESWKKILDEATVQVDYENKIIPKKD